MLWSPSTSSLYNSTPVCFQLSPSFSYPSLNLFCQYVFVFLRASFSPPCLFSSGVVCACVLYRECNSWSWRAHLFKHYRVLASISPTIPSARKGEVYRQMSYPQCPAVQKPEVIQLFPATRISYCQSTEVQNLCFSLCPKVKSLRSICTRKKV